MRNLRIAAGIAVAIALSFAALASAQDAGTEDPLRPDGPDAAAAAETDEAAEIPEELLEASVLDEIEVVVDPQGRSAFDIEEQREAQIRETIYAELRMRERREEEMAWRQADPQRGQTESRIKWGYSPQAQQRMRRGNDYMYELSIEQNKPAPIFSVDF